MEGCRASCNHLLMACYYFLFFTFVEIGCFTILPICMGGNDEIHSNINFAHAGFLRKKLNPTSKGELEKLNFEMYGQTLLPSILRNVWEI